MKQILKIFIVLIVLFLTAMSSFRVSAESVDLSFSGIFNKGNNFIDEGAGQKKDFDASKLISQLANILTTIGVVVVLAGLLIIGIKLMSASPEEAAKLKTKLVGLVIAGFVIIGAYGIWHFARYILESMTSGLG